MIKTNKSEAGILAGHPCDSKQEVQHCAEILNSRCVKNVIISMGGQGFYASGMNYKCHFDVEDSDIVDVTRTGDSIIAAAFLCILRGMSLRDSSLFARRCAALICKSNETVAGK